MIAELCLAATRFARVPAVAVSPAPPSHRGGWDGGHFPSRLGPIVRRGRCSVCPESCPEISVDLAAVNLEIRKPHGSDADDADWVVFTR